jgi:hypothetical protein
VPLDLAALVVEAGAVSAEDMERALARQREEGGALDTALLELGLLPEDEMVRFLSRASGLPPAPEGADEPDARARRVFPARVAERHGLAPFRLDGRELSLVGAFPVDLAAIDEIGFMLSLTLVPHVAPEWRVRALQARLYGAAMPVRLAALGEAARAAAPAAAHGEGGAPAPHEAAPPPQEPEPAPREPPREGAFGVAPEEPLAAALAQAVEAAEAEVLRAGAPAPVADAPPRWTVDEAFAALARASGRDEVVSVAVRYARDFFEAVALFATAGERLRGHDAAGWPGARERCRSVNLAAREVGLFRTVLGTGGPYLGPVVSADGNEALLAALGRASPRIALAYPIVLRDRTVAVLYADNGEAPVSPRRVGDLLLVLGGVGPAFERIVREAKRARGAPAAEPARGEGTWQAHEPARVEPAPPTPPPPDGDEYAVAPASEALAPAAPIEPAAAVDRLGATAPGSHERARLVRELVRAGPEGAAALATAFPGPLDAAARADAEALPVEERGPVLAALHALGPVATPYLVHLLQDADPERRRVAALLAGRAGDPAAFMPLADAALDGSPEVAAAALDGLAGVRRHEEFQAVVERLRRSLVGGDEARGARAAAALARLGDAGAVPLLVQSLDGPSPVAAGARAALEALTARRFADAPAWLAWWREHRGASRADWIFSALEDDDRDVRLAAADLLRAAGATPVRYFADAPPPERARSARAWRAFFEEQGYAL